MADDVSANSQAVLAFITVGTPSRKDSRTSTRITVLGLAFRPETDDMREAVSIPLIRRLLADGASVVYGPAAMQNAHAIFGGTISYANDPVECITDADCYIIVTEWDQSDSSGDRA